ncbi:hypothetical protein [Trinickia symbiotica]|nr:hypothetical protein [Trinickia symbiotica]
MNSIQIAIAPRWRAAAREDACARGRTACCRPNAAIEALRIAFAD